MQTEQTTPADVPTDAHTVFTPMGTVLVRFPEDGGSTYEGNEAAIGFLHHVMATNTNAIGATMSPENLEPVDLVGFCQPPGSGITVLEPLDMEGHGIAAPLTMDDANGMTVNEVAALRESLARERSPVARLPIMASILSMHARADTGTDETPTAPRQRMAGLYSYDENRKPAQRKRENTAAMALLAQIDAGKVDADNLTAEQKQTLAKYSGTGGALIGADGKKGSAYEYYTPLPIAEGVWAALAEMGFAGGKVLDPCAGTGIFGAAAPESATVDAVELNETSGRINELVNGGPGYKATVSPFERVAAATPDGVYDAVVSNVPFGEVADRGGNELLDPRYQREPLQNYFVLRSLEKLRPGGLAAFITPPRCVSGKGGKERDLRVKASFMAEFLGAYRLPNSVFGTAAADTMTDVMFFRKYSDDAAARIEELRQQDPEKLVEAMVQWETFTSGDYFKEDGRRFILGEMGKAMGQWGEVDVLTTTASVGEVGKMLRKLPDSRVNWELLNAAETLPVVYRDGDTITHAGQTLRMQDGRWIPLERTESQRDDDRVLALLADPYTAFEDRVGYGEARDAVSNLTMAGRALDVPDWVREALAAIVKMPAEQRAQAWNAGVVGLAVAQVQRERGGEDPAVNYLDEFTALSDAMQVQWATARNLQSKVGGNVKLGLKAILTHYNKRNGFSAVWRGDVLQQVQQTYVTADSSFDGLRYQLKSAWVPLDQARGVLGEDFDPMASDDWCLSADGKSVTRAADYYSGGYGDFLRKVDADIAASTDDAIRAKLLRQKLAAEKFIERVDVSRMDFNLFSPHVTAEEKAEFLRRFVNPAAVVVYDEKTGKARPDIDVKGSDLSDRDKLHNRIGDYIKNGTVTLGGLNLSMPDHQALAELRKMVNTANEQFNGWVRGNHTIRARLQAVADDPDRLRFLTVEDEEPLEIPGMNKVDPFTGERRSLHGFQNAFARQQGREFGGGNGFGVGLGKAQPLDAKIMTPDGWKRMGDMKVGDLVIAVDGTAVPVTGVFPQGEKEIFEVEFSDGAKTRCCDEHLWFTETENDRKRRLYRKSVGATLAGTEGSVKELREIAGSLIHGRKQKNHKIPMVAPIQFAPRELPVRPYLMGVLLGDGGMSHKGTSFTTVDGEIASRVAHLLHEGFGDEVSVVPYRCTDRAQSYGITRASPKARNPVRAELERFGLAGKGSAAKFIPNDYLLGSVEQRVELLRGLMDTDGYVSKDGITVQFTSTSRMLAEGVQQLVQSLGGTATIRTKATTHRDAHTVHLRMPPAINPFNLARKADRVKPKSKYLPVRYFTEVRPVGRAFAQCISIDHPTHLYVTDDYVVTHNTFTALACTQYVQSIGAKRKTAFVLPGSVLSKWRVEAIKAYASIEDCLFVGLRERRGGKMVVDPAAYDEDLNRVMENRHAKVFMTFEAWERLRLRDETIGDFGDYMRRVDASFAESNDKKQDERNKGKQAGALAVLAEKKGGAPYLEDLGFDSLVTDEAHAYKNASQTNDFKGGKYLSLAKPSGRGIDMQAKCWYIRDRNKAATGLADGVLDLTATPITNSPLEIYSMLAKAVGHERVNDLCMGIQGADQFMQMMCQIDTESDVTMDGIARETNVFTGLRNVSVLRRAIGAVYTIKNAEDVGAQVVVPDGVEQATPIVLPGDVVERLSLYKEAFRFAIDSLSERKEIRGSQEAYEAVAAHFGEPLNLIGHPFNLINKMTLLIADPELDQRATFYTVSPAQAKAAQDVIAKFNAKKITEDRARPGPFTEDSAIVQTKTKKADDGTETVVLKVQVRASLRDGNRIAIDTIEHDSQSAFEAMAEAAGLDLDVTVPPKLAAMLENYQKEEANPRGVDDSGNRSKLVKQLIFCDILPLHNKIKRLLNKRAGVPTAAIAIITGSVNNTPEEILEVQNAFNAHGDENRYRSVIANEKAEVGIDLQKGTQAIHHLTIGWTPDALTQRNGRGQRQGNKTAFLNIYHYDADGTFDSSKRVMVNKKADWIGNVMSVDGGDRVAITGGMSSEQLRMLIDTVGDADGMRRLQETMAAKEAEQRATNNRDRQLINIDTIRKQRDFVQANPDAVDMAIQRILAVRTLRQQVSMLQARAANPRATATAIAKNESLQAEVQARLDGVQRMLDSSITLARKEYNRDPVTVSVSKFLEDNATYRGKTAKDDDLAEMLRGRKYPTYAVTVTEGSQLHSEWASEIAMAQSMLDEAVAAYERQAADAGSFSAPVARAFAEGKAAIIGGRPVMDGAFVIVKDDIAIYDHESRNLYSLRPELEREAVNPIGRIKPSELQFVNPGDAEFDACATRAAGIEDAQAKAGRVRTTFSSRCPQVAERRKEPVMALYKVDSVYELPSPYFPIVLTGDVAKGGAVVARIFAEQTKIVQGFDDRQFVAAGDAGVLTVATPTDFGAALAQYAKAHGLKATYGDFQGSHTDLLDGMKAIGIAGAADLAAALAPSTTAEEVNAAFITWLAGMAPWFDWDTYPRARLVDSFPYFMDNEYTRAVSGARDRVREAERAAQIAAAAVARPADQGAAPAPAAEAATADPLGPVGISGDTKRWFQQIKSAATVAGGGKYLWDGKAGVWNVQRRTWDYIVANYPEAAKVLVLGQASKGLR